MKVLLLLAVVVLIHGNYGKYEVLYFICNFYREPFQNILVCCHCAMSCGLIFIL